MRVFRCHRECRRFLAEQGGASALVPTMGALHEGHLALIRQASQEAPNVVVSVFVNPLQFGRNEDLASYPRDEQGDLAKLEKEGVTAVYMPEAEDMYAKNAAVTVNPGRLGQELEGIYRPHFFAGVLTVVTKLFNRLTPECAVFGEKDFQQLLLVRRLVADLDMKVRIIGAPIVRMPESGLALSSRNAYFSAAELDTAAAFPRILCDTAEEIRAVRAGAGAKEAVRDITERCRRRLPEAGFAQIDYIEVRNAHTLRRPADYKKEQIRLLGAVRLNGVRLLDNLAC